MTTFSFKATSTVTLPSGAAHGLFMSPNGTRLYSYDSSNEHVYEYALSTPWDVKTATLTRDWSMGFEESLKCLRLNSEGTKLYLSGTSRDGIRQYTLSTGWTLSTVAYQGLISNCDYPFTFSDNGAFFYQCRLGNPTIIDCYSIGTAWNVLSPKTLVNSLTGLNSIISFHFLDDGNRLLTTTTTAIYEYSLSTSWDITTATLINTILINTLSTYPASATNAFFTNQYMYLVGGAYSPFYQYDADYTPLSSPGDFIFEDGVVVATPGDEANFNFLPDEDYHILTLSASLPMLTMEATGNCYEPPYNAININLPMLTCEMEGNSWQGVIGDTHGDIVFDLPMLECVMYSGGAVIEFDLPMLTVEMTTLPDPITAQIEFDLPMLTVEMTQIDPISASISISLPMLTCEMEGDAAFTEIAFSLPMLTMIAYTGAAISMTLPMLEMEATASIAKSMSINATLPMLEIVMNAGSNINLTLPMLEASMSGDSENVSSISASLPMLRCLFEGNNSSPIKIEATLPMLTVNMSSAGNLYNEISTSLPILTVEMHCINQGVCSIDTKLPMIDVCMSGSSYRAGGNYIEMELPMLRISGEISNSEESVILRHIRGQER